jgi:hypothetical protein
MASSALAMSIGLSGLLMGWVVHRSKTGWGSIVPGAFGAWIIIATIHQWFMEKSSLPFFRVFPERIVWGESGADVRVIACDEIAEIHYSNSVGESNVFAFWTKQDGVVQYFSRLSLRQDEELISCLRRAMGVPMFYNGNELGPRG